MMSRERRDEILASFLDLVVPFQLQYIDKNSKSSVYEWQGHKLHELVGWGATNKHLKSLVCTIESFSRGCGGYLKTEESKPQEWSINLVGGIAGRYTLSFGEFEANWELRNPQETTRVIEEIRSKANVQRERPLKKAVESAMKKICQL